MRRNVRVALRQKNGFPCPSRIHKWTSTLLSRHFVPLRRMNWVEDLLFNRINVKLNCAVFVLSNIFSYSDILNFETNLFPIVPPAKINACKAFNPKYLQQQKILCTVDCSQRGNFGQKSQPALKWNAQVKLWTEANIALPGIVRNEKKGSLTSKKSFCKEAENWFSPGKN